MAREKFGYVEEVAMTKLALAELEQQLAAATKRRSRKAAYVATLICDLAECRAHLEELLEV